MIEIQIIDLSRIFEGLLAQGPHGPKCTLVSIDKLFRMDNVWSIFPFESFF